MLKHETFTLTYPQRLETFQLEPLEYRRLKFDLVQTYKITHGICDLVMENFFDNPDPRTRGHSKRLREKRGIKDSRQHFFAYRVVQVWNSLSERTVCAVSIAQFKRFLSEEDLRGFLRGHALN
jgi:hypothetical protein